MGLNILSTLALVSLITFSSIDHVAARPHQIHTHTKTVRSTLTTVIKPASAPAPGFSATTYTTMTVDHTPAVSTPLSGAVSAPASEPAPLSGPKNPKGTATKGKQTSATAEGTTLPSSSSSKYPAQDYTLVKEFCTGGTAFFDQFNFFTGADPTHGFVNYVDRATAQSSNLIGVTNGTIVLAPDSTNLAPNGRSSVRLESIDTFTEVLIIADFAHLPAAYYPFLSS